MSDNHFRMGKYRLLELLYEGHHTEVWLAENVKIRKRVAIKILISREVHSGNARLFVRKLFLNEAKTLARLAHPHIVQVFDYEDEEEHGWPYMVMEFAPLGSLTDRYTAGERLSLPMVRSYTSQIGRAIHYIHTQGLIHRDIKPQNMFLKTRNAVLLGDFGLVMPIHEKHYPWMKMEFGGTRLYMAPEQEVGEPVPSSDQYAYATVVFEWLTGYWPFYGTAKELSWQRRHLAPPLLRDIVPEIPEPVEWVVLKALDKSPGRRFETMLDFTLAFEAACQQPDRNVYDIPTGHFSAIPSINRQDVHTGFAEVHGYQTSAGLVSQPNTSKVGDVLVSAHPVMSHSWQSIEDFIDPLFTSDGTESSNIIILRWLHIRRRIQPLWKRISKFLWGDV
jgi:eukaryotic-like serine/threonine-protein kinase